MSDILIKNMEMPKEEFGNLLLLIAPNKAIHCTENDKIKDYEVVEIPEHGRLIDADKLKSHLKTSFENKVGGFTYELFFDFMIDILDNVPTILEASK